MKLLDSLTIGRGPDARVIELCQGDLTEMRPDEAVDVLVASAFPNDYSATPSSLIGALERKGVLVWKLARDKAFDLRQTHSCWLSQEITDRQPGIEFRRLLCFEPAFRGGPAEVVGDIFRCLASLSGERPPIRSAAMPLVATGVQGESVSDMFEAIMGAALHWLALDYPLRRLKVSVFRQESADELSRRFLPLREKFAVPDLAPSAGRRYDVFVSYSRKNADKAKRLVEELRRRRPGLRLFYDQLTLRAGTAWQQEIYEAVEACTVFVALYSPEYLESKVCLEEFHLAKFCNREAGTAALVPLYLYSAGLPAYMKLLNYVDCREGDEARLREACGHLLSVLDGLS